MVTDYMIKDFISAILILINIIGFINVWVDKYRAKKHLWRIPEKNFFILAFIGACPGIYIGLKLFRHKTKHRNFMLGIPLIFIIQVSIIVFFLYLRDME